MRNLKKFLALVLAMMMTLSLMVTVNAKSFDDVDSTSTYAEAIAVLKGLGVVKGDENSNFNPKDPITRAEVAAMIYRLVTADVTDSNVKLYENSGYFFSDVFSGKWYNGYVNYCANNGLVKGVGGDRFAPSADVTGYEALVMILRAIGYTNDDTFSGSDWKFKASGYARELGITDGIAEGALGAPATREMVAQIMFNGLQAPMVRGNILGYNPIELVAATDANRVHYAKYLASGGSLPIYETLMRRSFNIVGKSKELSRDDFGRPAVQWIYDHKDDKVVESGASAGDASKYIINATKYDGTNPINARAEANPLKINLDYFKVYDNVITECQLATDINDNKGFDADIWLNGQQMMTADGGSTVDVKTIDELHTVDTFVNSQGRTLEAYKYEDPADGDTLFTLVMIDTFLGRVVATSPKTVDTAGHEMQPATATIAVGYDSDGGKAMTALQELKIKTDKYKVGDLVLVQTSQADKKDDTGNARVDTLAEITPFPTVTDVPETIEEFPLDGSGFANGVVVGSTIGDVTVVNSFTVLGTKIATKGLAGGEEIKTGIEGANGKVYWLSNTYIAASDAAGGNPDTAVLDAYHQKVTNNLINRTFNLFLDHHGYIIGMQETSTTNVGVVTGVDYDRVSAGNYTVTVAVTDVNGNNVELNLLNHKTAGDRLAKDFFASADAAEDYFRDDNDGTGGLMAIPQEGEAAAQDDKILKAGLLIQWSNVMKNGTQYQVIDKIGTDYDDAAKDSVDAASNSNPDLTAAANDRPIVRTGVTDTLDAAARIDDNTKFLIANYKVDYSAAADLNKGAMTLDGYKPYTGFKTIPTINSITATDGDNAYVQWSKLTSNGQDYFAISAEDAKKGYTMIEQQKFAVDESYLFLNSGTTYQFYSTYEALKNGEKVPVNVSNLNDAVNDDIQKYMAGAATVELVTLKGKDAAGNVNAVAVSTDKGHFNTRPTGGTGGTNIVYSADTYPAYKAGVLTVDSGTYLTMADNAKVVIVNAANSVVTPATVDHINQYASTEAGTNYFCYELDANGYVSVLYIVD